MKRKAETPEVADLSPKRNRSVDESSVQHVAATLATSEEEAIPSEEFSFTYVELQMPEADFDGDEDDSPSDIISRGVPRHAIKLEEPSDGSEYKISEPASERLLNLYAESDKRNPNEFGIVHIYEDYHPEGVLEVLENEILDYKMALARPKPSNTLLFEIAEALAFFLTSSYDLPWNHGDGERCDAILRLIGALYLDILNRLNKLAVSQRDAFQNLGLIVGFMILTNEDLPGDQQNWGNEIRRIAREWGLKVLGHGGKELSVGILQDIPEMRLQEDDSAAFDFAVEFENYKQHTSDPMGGARQDLSKISQEEINALNSGNSSGPSSDEGEEDYGDNDDHDEALLEEEEAQLDEVADPLLAELIAENGDVIASENAYNAIMKSLAGFNPDWPAGLKLPPTASTIFSLDYANYEF